MESTPKAEAKETTKAPKEPAQNGTPGADNADKPKRERRQRKPKDSQDASATADKEKQDKPSNKDQAKKPVENGTAEEKPEASKDDKLKKERRERPKKQDRPETAQPAETKPLYRKKGETSAADDTTPAAPKRERGPMKCFNCDKEGHQSRECPEPKKERERGPMKCFNCQKEGHGSRECPEPKKERAPKKCFNCDKEGHVSPDCPEPKKERERGPMKCFNCQKEGHGSRECPEPKKERAPIKCFNCDKEGHGSRDCPEPKKEKARAPIKCFNCDKEGHGSRDCPEPKKEKARAPRKCFNCDKEGHVSPDCPEPKKEKARAPRKCFNCDKEGHQSPDCPEPQKERAPKKCFNCDNEGHQSRECPEPKKERPQKKEKESKDEATPQPTEDGAEPVKKENRRKKANNKEKAGQEPKYRPKGEKSDETPDGAKADGPTEGEGEESKEKTEKKKEPDAPKNLIYKNPMDFKEKRKFKTKWEEYRHGDWRKGSGKTFVTLETEIPTQPDKLLKPAEEKAFHSKQVEIEDKIKEITSFLEEKKTSFEDILGQKTAQMKAGDTGVVFSKELSQKFVRMGELKKERQAIYNVQDTGDNSKSELIAIVEQMKIKIDKQYYKEEMIPKAIKEAQKDFQTSSGNYKKEQELIRRTAFLKDSIPCIQKRDAANEKLQAMKASKKESGVDLPRIKTEMNQLQKEIDKLKEGQSAKTETKEAFDTQLDDINARRKKLRDDRDKLYKQKEELRDAYYGSLIDFTKQQYLLQDITWMSDMQSKLKVRQEEKEKRDKEYQERRDRITKEREEKKQREDDRKQRDADRKLKEVENKKMMEENLKQDEIDKLKRYDEDIADNALKSNPLFEQIEQCDQLTAFCKKQTDKSQPDEASKAEETKEEAQDRVKGELEKALKKGSIQLAPTKEEKMTSQFDSLKTTGNKGKKQKKNRDVGQDGSIDFVLIKKFNSLKISAPIKEEDYEKTIQDLAELRTALIYWGKIIQRQNKIKFIRNARKISSIDEYVAQAEEEEKFIETEKSKFDSDETAKEINISLDKLKMAQIIHRESRANRVWKDESEEEESEEEEGSAEEEETPKQPIFSKKGGQVDLYGDDDNKKKKTTKSKKRRDASDDSQEDTQVKQTKRPNAQKFKEIMKADDAFPTLENDFEDDVDDLGETPAGEINSQE